ncbi:DNA-binding transcriptional regulator, PadR family [Nocardia amikacinitolerans]|uniref:PadR family transcriptional regulator n=1 Tax=Nocardia amikacinitolerans TaxID=756689 RepID=UPI00082B3661|nr:PadR family transcriptional regulator [Nocardia amikacinitolerans]MCP2316887.1 DNA-binding transcriptional regulator, PadR family [Nocardia amikacinitolerans]
MNSVRLLVLGALRRRGRAHGYQVRTDLESWGAHEWSTATSGSVYHALRSMAGKGLLVAHETAPSAAGGPPRTEYELTDAGEQEYLTLLSRALADREPGLDVLGAAIGLIEDLPREHALRMLRERSRAMRDWRTSITAHLPADTDLDTWGPVGEVLSLWLTTADTGAQWTDRLIRRLEEGAFTMADEAADSTE